MTESIESRIEEAYWEEMEAGQLPRSFGSAIWIRSAFGQGYRKALRDIQKRRETESEAAMAEVYVVIENPAYEPSTIRLVTRTLEDAQMFVEAHMSERVGQFISSWHQPDSRTWTLGWMDLEIEKWEVMNG